MIPIGRGLLYVQPIYLQAVSSPMPELRIVVLATQEHLSYGSSFSEAMTNLFGAMKTPDAKTSESPKPPVVGKEGKEQAPPAALPPDVRQLIERASAEFGEYETLSRAGKFGDAGQKLEALKKTLEELKKAQSKKQ